MHSKSLNQKLDRESLLRIPLIMQMLNDPHAKLVERAVDINWWYQGFLNERMSGFNPSQGQIYYGRLSRTAQWLRRPEKSPRNLNSGDFLYRELFFTVHDYLHQWAYRCIAELCPDLRFGVGTLTENKIEQAMFCHLLTEAAATVGLDYWYLSLQDLNEKVPIGTAFGPLTTRYIESYLPEYQLCHPGAIVQDVSFFDLMTQFYCSGEFPGLVERDLERSPITTRWILHEIAYGETGRNYTRNWMLLLSGSDKELSEEELQMPVACNKKWQRDLTKKMGQLLWDKVKLGKDPVPPALSKLGKPWKTPKRSKAIDFRFFNINSFGDKFWEPLMDVEFLPRSGGSLFAQIVSKYEYSKVAPEAMTLLEAYKEKPDLKIMRYILREYKPLKIKGSEPEDLFLPN